MKRFLTGLFISFIFILSANAQIQWQQLSPMQELSHEEYLSLFTDNYEHLKGALYEMSFKRVIVCYMDEEPEYDIPKAKNAGPRMLVCLEMNSDENPMFFKAVCVDCYQENPAAEIHTNRFGFCMQVLDSKGKNQLLYTGILVDDIGFYPLGNIVVGTGAYENSFDCNIKEAPFYFWDKTSKKAMCFYSNGAVLTKTNIKVENPMFGFSASSRDQEYRELFFMDIDSQTGMTKSGKVWLCSGTKFQQVKE
ncbi:MAG: hypothetical protein K5681_01750 [Treponema sp.]|nr:hypothetical protein [Treponema sp.]